MTSRRVPSCGAREPVLPLRAAGLVLVATPYHPHLSSTQEATAGRRPDRGARAAAGAWHRAPPGACPSGRLNHRRRDAHYVVMAEYSYLVLTLPRGTSRDAARRILTDHAEYGQWELARMVRSADGSGKATLRRQIIRQRATLDQAR